jgi:homoserine dehydrogenase
MIREYWSFDEALTKAQELGFAEADPTLDINGSDATHKLAVLATIAFNAAVDKRNIYTEGIENIDLKDVVYAKELGYVIKLLAIAKRTSDHGMSLSVRPTLLPAQCTSPTLRTSITR